MDKRHVGGESKSNPLPISSIRIVVPDEVSSGILIFGTNAACAAIGDAIDDDAAPMTSPTRALRRQQIMLDC